MAAGRRAPPALVVSAVSQALFWYLERAVPSTLKWVLLHTQHTDIYGHISGRVGALGISMSVRGCGFWYLERAVPSIFKWVAVQLLERQ